MDPTACYLIILETFREHNYARAREYALILKTWLEAGGFYPSGFKVVEVHDMLGRILRPACNAPALRFPFARIICNHCDAGTEIETLPDAIDTGWYKIDITVDLPGISHIGTCPVCRKKQEEDC